MSASERRIAELEAEVDRLQRLLGAQMRTGESLEVGAIVNSDGEPRVDLRWDQLAAQLSTEEARDLALNVLRVAEWAEVDAIAFVTIREEFDERTAAGLMAMLRKGRGEESDRSGSAKA